MAAATSDRSPLAGRSVVVPRAAAQAASLVDRLAAEGAVVLRFPLIEVVFEPDDLAALRASAAMLGPSDWTAFTSANAVAACEAAGILGQIRTGFVAAIGDATERALVAADVHVDFVPSASTAAALAIELPAIGTVMLPLAELADNTLATGLTARGLAADRVTAYRSIQPDHDQATVDAVRAADLMLATAPSVVDRLVEVLGSDAIVEPLVCIGPTTASRAAEFGLATVVAEPHNDEGLVEAARQTLATRR
ncbi:MAG: uroporphyrinogen-III synthase [Acidimicrobiales bacterium]